jgi:hypothetical protein
MNWISLEVAFTPEEHEMLADTALLQHLTVAQYVHHAALAFRLSQQSMEFLKSADKDRINMLTGRMR